MRTLPIAVLAVLIVSPVRAVEIPSPTGYYEGSLTYAAEYFTDVSYMAMQMKAKSDFWFIADEAGKVTGQGEVDYDFGFGIDWGLAVKQGLTVLKVLGVSLDPKVTIELDPKTAHQSYSLSGEVTPPANPGAPAELTLLFSWTDPAGGGAPAPRLHLDVVGSLTASGSIGVTHTGTVGPVSSNTGGSFGTTRKFSTVVQTIDWTPVSPFGQDTSRVRLTPRSAWGPFATSFDYDGSGTSGGTGVTVHWRAVQKIDFGVMQELVRLRQQVAAGTDATRGPR